MSDSSSLSSGHDRAYDRINARLSKGSEYSRSLAHRASHVIVDIPVERLRRMKNADGVGSVARETQFFVGITTMHGPLRIYRGKKWAGLLWACWVLASFSLLVYQMISLLELYTSKPTISDVTFDLPEEGIDFPSVTICNFNPIRKSYIRSLNKTGDFNQQILDYLIQTNFEVSGLYRNSDRKELREGHEAWLAYNQNHPNFTIEQFFHDSGFDCPSIMMICSFGGRRFDCCKYAKPKVMNLGRCHTLDLQRLGQVWMHKQISAGVNSGLQVVLDAHLEEEFDGAGDEAEPPFTQSFENGYRYYIHAPEADPYLSSEGISVSPMMRVYSAITSKKFVLLGRREWGNCTNEWPADYSTTLAYSSANCVSLCRARFFNERCGCSPAVYDVDDQHTICAPWETYQCVQNHLLDVNSPTDALSLPKCDECGKECLSWSYEAFNSYGYGWSHGALAWLQRQNKRWNLDHIKTNFLAINVFYREMSYTEYTQVQGTTLTEVLSDIGGNMGMCLGMSLITCMEAILYFSKIAWISISKHRRNYMLQKKKTEEDREQALERAVYSRSIDVERDEREYPQGIIKPECARKSSIEERTEDRNKKRARFMNDFMDDVLYGSGRVNVANPEEQNKDVIELKIDLKQLKAQLLAPGGRRARSVTMPNPVPAPSDDYYYHHRPDNKDESEHTR